MIEISWDKSKSNEVYVIEVELSSTVKAGPTQRVKVGDLAHLD